MNTEENKVLNKTDTEIIKGENNENTLKQMDSKKSEAYSSEEIIVASLTIEEDNMSNTQRKTVSDKIGTTKTAIIKTDTQEIKDKQYQEFTLEQTDDFETIQISDMDKAYLEIKRKNETQTNIGEIKVSDEKGKKEIKGLDTVGVEEIKTLSKTEIEETNDGKNMEIEQKEETALKITEIRDIAIQLTVATIGTKKQSIDAIIDIPSIEHDDRENVETLDDPDNEHLFTRIRQEGSSYPEIKVIEKLQDNNEHLSSSSSEEQMDFGKFSGSDSSNDSSDSSNSTSDDSTSTEQNARDAWTKHSVRKPKSIIVELKKDTLMNTYDVTDEEIKMQINQCIKDEVIEDFEKRLMDSIKSNDNIDEMLISKVIKTLESRLLKQEEIRMQTISRIIENLKKNNKKKKKNSGLPQDKELRRRADEIYGKDYAVKPIDNTGLKETIIEIELKIARENIADSVKSKISETIKQLDKCMDINGKLSLKFRIDITVCIIKSIADDLNNDELMLTIMSNLNTNTNFRNKAKLLLTKRMVMSSSKITTKDVNIYGMDYSGLLKREETKVVIVNTKHDVDYVINLTQNQITTFKSDLIPDPFVQRMLKEVKMVILDYDNMIKAMKIEQNVIKPLCEYLAGWGISTMVIVTDKNNEVVGPTINLVIGKGEHDDIAMMVVGRVHKAAIMTLDNHNEFRETFTVCTKHGTIQTRKDEGCDKGNGQCTLTVIKKKAMGKIPIKNVTIVNNKIRTLEAYDGVIIKGKINAKMRYTKFNCIHNDKTGVTKQCNWIIPNVVRTGPILARSIALEGAKMRYTMVKITLARNTFTAVASNGAAAMLAVLAEAGAEVQQAVKSITTLTLKVVRNVMVIYNDNSKEIVGKSREITPDANMYTNNPVTVIYNEFKTSLTVSDKTIIGSVNEQLLTNNNYIDLDECIILLEERLLELDLAIIESNGTHILVKIDVALAEILQGMAVENIILRQPNNIQSVFVMPLTVKTRAAITAQYVSSDSDGTTIGFSNDSSIISGHKLSGLTKYFTAVNPDKPSHQLIAAPDSTTFVLSTIGLDVTIDTTTPTIVCYNNINDKSDYLTSSTATQIYQQFEKIEETQKVIHISTVHWQSAGVKSMGCSNQELIDIRMAVHDIVEEAIRDVTKDIINVFANLMQGYNLITLPCLLKAKYIPTLKVKKGCNVCPIQIDWALPTCSVITRIIVNADYSKSVIACLVSVSPPITYNYICAITGCDITLENEYNTVMCEAVENETYNLFEYIEDKMDYMSLYFAAYGVFSKGLQIMGHDPIKLIMESSPMIEAGTINMSKIVLSNTHLRIRPQLNTIEWLKSLTEGPIGAMLSKTVTKGKWNRSYDTHLGLTYLFILAKANNQNAFLMCYQTLQVIVGLRSIKQHYTKCYSSKWSKSVLNSKQVFAMFKNQTKTMKGEKCKCIYQELAEQASAMMTPVRAGYGNVIDITYADQRITFDPVIGIKENEIRKLSIYHPCANRIPVTGKILLLIIKLSNRKTGIITRGKYAITVLKDMDSLTITEKIINLETVDSIYQQIATGVREARLHNQHVIIIGSDKLGSIYKGIGASEKRQIEVPNNMVIYIPDALLFNAIKREIVYVNDENEDIITMNDETVIVDDPLVTTARYAAEKFGNVDIETLLKVLTVLLLLLLLAFGWPYVMKVVLLPATLYAYIFPVKIIGYTNVELWQQLLGMAPSAIYATRSVLSTYFVKAMTWTWTLSLATAVAQAARTFLTKK